MSSPRRGGTSAVALAVATAAGNVLAYVFTIAMSRLLGVRDFGELGTLLGVWLIAQIPAVACQLTVARAVAAGAVAAQAAAPAGGGAGTAVGSPLAGGVGAPVAAVQQAPGGSTGGGSVPMLWLGVRLGTAGAAVLALAGLPLAAVLHVGVAGAAWLAAGQLPLTVLFAALGVLQGRAAFGLFGGLLAGFQAVRLVAGVAAAAAGLGPAGVLASTAAASLAAAVAGWWLAAAPAHAPRVRTGAPSTEGPRVHGLRGSARHRGTLLRGTASMGALMLLTTTDLLLAGHFLTGEARGVYASGNVLTRIAFWGPQFVGTLAYPRLVRPADRARARRLALLAVGGLGVAGVTVALLAGRPLVALVFGPAYRPLGPLAPLFVAVGAAAAVINLVLLDDVATGRTLGTRLAFAALAIEAACVALWWHDSPAQVVAVAAVVCSAAAVLAVAVTAGRAVVRPASGTG